MTASPDLTLDRVVESAMGRKGMQIVGVVDAVCTGVLAELKERLASGALRPADGGGFLAPNGTILLPGVEAEVSTAGVGVHYLVFLRDLPRLEGFAEAYASTVRNPSLSSQRSRLSPHELLALAKRWGGLFVLAHAFTPHKGFFGAAASRLSDVFSAEEIAQIDAIELGLSADTSMARQAPGLESLAFLSSSDAHSDGKIGREYTALEMKTPGFDGLRAALRGEGAARITGNYGLDPRLGKYYRTFCLRCRNRIPLRPDRMCPHCGGGGRVVVGVADRLAEIADKTGRGDQRERPPYTHQIPLEFVPGVGKRTLNRLLDVFGTEMRVLHDASETELARAVGGSVASAIVAARSGKARVRAGGGGVYGKMR